MLRRTVLLTLGFILALLVRGNVQQAYAEQVPILIVHGWHDDCTSFTDMKQFLQQQIGGSVECFQYKSTQTGGIAAAKQLKSYIDKNYPTGQIDIVAHSFGGLVSRWYQEQLGGGPKVRRFIMLGTPNRGNWLAGYRTMLMAFPDTRVHIIAAAAGELDRAVRDMDPLGHSFGRLLTLRSVTIRYSRGSGTTAQCFGAPCFRTTASSL